jgi:hypothetical protein
MYPRIPWEQVADPLGTMEQSLGTTALEKKSYDHFMICKMCYISSTSPAACTARKIKFPFNNRHRKTEQNEDLIQNQGTHRICSHQYYHGNNR